MSGHRVQRVADLVRETVSSLLRGDVRDPRLGFVTVTDVRMSQDLRSARVFVSVLDEDKQPSLDALRRATPFIRRELGRRAKLRHTPELRFIHDESVETGFRLDALLEEEGAATDLPPDDGDSGDAK
ncbi:MAG: 30S ribosome-binding factor RbfA [bacterium]|nr:30S ribosome-binding factor RbfA [bacterium]